MSLLLSSSLWSWSCPWLMWDKFPNSGVMGRRTFSLCTGLNGDACHRCKHAFGKKMYTLKMHKMKEHTIKWCSVFFTIERNKVLRRKIEECMGGSAFLAESEKIRLHYVWYVVPVANWTWSDMWSGNQGTFNELTGLEDALAWNSADWVVDWQYQGKYYKW